MASTDSRLLMPRCRTPRSSPQPTSATRQSILNSAAPPRRSATRSTEVSHQTSLRATCWQTSLAEWLAIACGPRDVGWCVPAPIVRQASPSRQTTWLAAACPSSQRPRAAIFSTLSARSTEIRRSGGQRCRRRLWPMRCMRPKTAAVGACAPSSCLAPWIIGEHNDLPRSSLSVVGRHLPCSAPPIYAHTI